MNHRPAEPLPFDADARPVIDGDDPIEFAEFTGDGNASSQSSSRTQESSQTSSPSSPVNSAADDPAADDPVFDAAPAEAAPAAAPGWFRRQSGSKSDGGPEEHASRQQTTGSGEADSGAAESRKTASRGPASRGPASASKSPARTKSRKARRQKPNSPAHLIDVPQEEEPPLDWRRDWKKIALAWLTSAASCGYGISLLFHTTLLAGLSAIIYTNMSSNESISMVMAESDSMPVEFEEVMDFKVESAGSPEKQLPQLQKIPLNSTSSTLASDILSDSLSATGGDGEGGQADEGFGFKFSMPKGGEAVTKGSFTAWTVPKDPEPDRDYMIAIRIRLPGKMRLYRISDLSGKVVGTDSYVQELPRDPSRPELTAMYERGGKLVKVRRGARLRVVKNHVQIMIPVKGAASLVRDTIEVKSRLLDEEQKLEIVF